MTAAACVSCGAPRAAGPECPQCGVIYERAERRTRGPQGPSAAALFALGQRVDDARTEVWLARLAVPGALLACWLAIETGMGAFLLRTFLSMWVHELGHATAAWLSGFPAFPGPWQTLVFPDRSFFFGFMLAAGAGWGLRQAWETRNRVLAAAAIAFLLLQLYCSLVVGPYAARTFITWGGDGLGMPIGVALMATFFTPPDHKLHRDWLRWGFLVIGAAGFADIFHVWWSSRSDYSKIPLGEYSHGDADPYVLLQGGWPLSVIVGRYLTSGYLSLAILIGLYVLNLKATAARLAAVERGEDVSKA